MKILFATDGSVNADIALQSIVERDWPAGTSCRVVTVAERLNDILDAVVFGLTDMAVRAQADLEEDLQALLSECEQKLKEKFGAENVSKEFLQGNPRTEVIEAAKRWGSDVLIIGSHGHDADDSWWGSVTRSVVHNAPCTVLVLNAPSGYSMEKQSRSPEKIVESRYLVAVSDENNAKFLTEHILELPWPVTSRFQVLSVVPKSADTKHSRFFKSASVSELRQKAFTCQKEAAQTLVNTTVKKLETKFSAENVTGHVLEGNPRSTILQIAQDWPADMIIMGAHDKEHGVVEHFLGSTASAVAWNAECSVDLVQFAKVASLKK